MKTLTMKKSLVIFTFLFLANGLFVKAQENLEQECNIKYNMFKVDVKNKNYDVAYDNWKYVFDNCPDYTINTYKYGMDIAEYRYANAATDADKKAAKELVEKVYEQRLKYYPNENPAKMYSEWAMFKYKAGDSEPEYFVLLEKAYKIDPTDMGVVAIPLFYQGIINRNKDTNVQYIFDMYDNLSEVVNTKVDGYSRQLEELEKMEAQGTALSSTQERNKVAYTVNLEGLGQVGDVITDMSEEYATCDRLIPLYESEFENHKTDITWLKRSVSRLQSKGCSDSDFYDKIVETYINVDPSCDAFVSYASLQIKKGDENKALEYFKKAVDCQEDNYKKADILYNIAVIMKGKGRYAEARSYANQALDARPNLGRAYLLIGSMYSATATSCGGGDSFSVRMVYQAALEKAYKAKSVDPSISGQANKAIASWGAMAPTREDVFNKGVQPGSSWRINCWIGETVRVP